MVGVTTFFFFLNFVKKVLHTQKLMGAGKMSIQRRRRRIKTRNYFHRGSYERMAKLIFFCFFLFFFFVTTVDPTHRGLLELPEPTTTGGVIGCSA